MLNRRIATHGVMKFIILVKALLLKNKLFTIYSLFYTKLIPEIQDASGLRGH